MYQVAWQVVENGLPVSELQSYFVKPYYHFRPPVPGCLDFTFEHVEQKGKDIRQIFNVLEADLLGSDGIICHNAQYDHGVIIAASQISGAYFPIGGFPWFCSMKGSMMVTRLRGQNNQLKWPRLSELVKHYLGNSHSNQHNAVGDVLGLVTILPLLLNDPDFKFYRSGWL